jgi:hypothetical protein
MALKTDGLGQGTLWVWGDNTSSQLGDGTVTSRDTPLGGAASLVALTGGDDHTIVQSWDGSLWGWGENANGSIGDGSTTLRRLPMRIGVVPEALALEAGTSYSVALGSDGRVWAWGLGSAGQLGTGGTSNASDPVAVPAFTVVSNSWLAADTDQDGLSNAAEYRMGTDPLNPDTNGDGLPDGVEAQMGQPPFSPDSDADGLLNSKEIELGTDPDRPDTDGDGVLDGADCAPLDATRSSCPTDQNDHTPPVITLQEPASATPIP